MTTGNIKFANGARVEFSCETILQKPPNGHRLHVEVDLINAKLKYFDALGRGHGAALESDEPLEQFSAAISFGGPDMTVEIFQEA